MGQRPSRRSFFVVGMEIKRELVRGDLHRRTASLSVFAAFRGMVVPGCCTPRSMLAVSGAVDGRFRWRPTLRFALVVMVVLGSRGPQPLKLFLLTLAIVDDIGAIFVIASFYRRGSRSDGCSARSGLCC